MMYKASYLPVPVSFLLDGDGQIERKLDETFERDAAPRCAFAQACVGIDQRGKRFWSRSYIKKIIHESEEL